MEGKHLRSLLIRFVTNVIAIFLVAWGLPQLFPDMAPVIAYDDYSSLLIFAGLLAFANAFIKPILNLLALPITCMTAGLFALVINVVMFFIAAWLTSLFNRTIEIGWLGAIIGAIAVSIVGLVVNMIVPDERR